MGGGGSKQLRFGLNYNPVNSAAGNYIDATQGIATLLQNQACSQYSQKVISFINAIADMLPVDEKMSGNDFKKMTLPMLIETINNTSEIKQNDKQAVIKAVSEFITVFVNNSVDNSGNINTTIMKQNLVSVLKSFCPNIPNSRNGPSTSNFGMSNNAKYGIAGGVILIIVLIVGFIIYKKKHSFGRRR
jgi:hypothetical protein